MGKVSLPIASWQYPAELCQKRIFEQYYSFFAPVYVEPHQWWSGSALKAGRQEVPGLIPSCICQPSCLEFITNRMHFRTSCLRTISQKDTTGSSLNCLNVTENMSFASLVCRKDCTLTDTLQKSTLKMAKITCNFKENIIQNTLNKGSRAYICKH